MAKVKLGKDQTIRLDGVLLEGTRELDIDLSAKTTDITAWDHLWASVVCTSIDATIKLTIYWKEDFDQILPALTRRPPDPVSVQVSNVGTFRCLPTAVRISQPISGVLAWDVTLQLHSYNP